MQAEEMESIDSGEAWVSREEMLDLVRRGKLRDGVTLASWMMYAAEEAE